MAKSYDIETKVKVSKGEGSDKENRTHRTHRTLVGLDRLFEDAKEQEPNPSENVSYPSYVSQTSESECTGGQGYIPVHYAIFAN